MSTVQEMHQLLHNLVEEWPGDHNHPTVERARELLGKSPSLSDRMLVTDDCNWSVTDYQEFHDAMWYSI